MQQHFHLLIFFNTSLHVSGDKFAHPQAHYLTVYTFKNAPEEGRICRPKQVGLN